MKPIKPSLPNQGVILFAVIWFTAISFVLQRINEYQILIIGTVAISAVVGVGLNILMGLSGQISLGHAAFYAIGAYTAGILSTNFGWNYWNATLVATCVAGVGGLLLSLPGLRLRGPYLAMVTIAFGYFVEQGVANWKDLTGGWNGLMGIPAPTWVSGELFSAKDIAWAATLFSAVLVVAYSLFSKSRWGRMMRASKDAEIAAESLGIRLVWIRVLAFALSSAIAGLGGAFFATLNGFISPESFPFFQSIVFLLIVLIGGRGSAVGPLLGSLVVILLPESISFLAEYRLMFFGGLLMVVLWIAPQGLTGLFEDLRERFFAPLINSRSRSANLEDSLEIGSLELNNKKDSPFGLNFVVPPTSLILNNVGIQFGGNYALSGINLTIQSGSVTSLIGPNGAGKTTLINILGGFYEAGQGRFKLNEKLMSGMSTYQIGRAGVARTFQTSQLFAEMSVFENVRVAVYRGLMFNGWSKDSPIEYEDVDSHCLHLLRTVGFRGNPQAKASGLAHVDKRLVEIARALAMSPIFLLLDEPAAGLSKDESKQLGVLLRDIARAGVGVLLVEHDMSLVMGVSDCIHVLEAGRLIASGTALEIQNNERVAKAYLGDGEIDFKNLDQTSSVESGSLSSIKLTKSHNKEESLRQDLNVSESGSINLSIYSLNASYGAAPVLNNINLSVSRGQSVSILGPNGAGKSTLLRSIAGLHSQKSGHIKWQGEEISHLPAHLIAGMGLTLIPEGRQVFSELSVDDNIRLGAFSRNSITEQEISDLYEIFPKLLTLRGQAAGSLSGGEQQMLAFARGLAAKPQILMLDEPSLGLAPNIVKELFLKLSKLSKTGMTLLLVDQMAGLAMALSNHSHLMNAGDMIFSGTPNQLIDSGLLEQTYFENHSKD